MRRIAILAEGALGWHSSKTAIGVMREAFDMGISIPQQLSVIGFDDVRLAQFVIPPLTTVQMSQTEIARLAFKALISEMERESPSPTGTEYVLETNLVLRKSTALASHLRTKL